MKNKPLATLISLVLVLGITGFALFHSNFLKTNELPDDMLTVQLEAAKPDLVKHEKEVLSTVKKSKPAEKTEGTVALKQQIAVPNRITQENGKLILNEDHLNIVGLGDSLTVGVGDVTKLGYIGHFRSHLEVEDPTVQLYNYGKKGHDTSDMLKRLKDPAVRGAVEGADVILMTIGGNDVFKIVKNHFLNLEMELFHKQEKVYTENLDKILQTVRELNPDSQIYYVGLFNPFFEAFPGINESNQIIDSWNESSQRVLSKYENTSFIPIQDLFEANTGSLLAGDFFHPNEQGYKLIGDRIVNNAALGLPLER
ncbi:SGNH/GDSL hydrolase family protein [Mesobacillus harenae]|uniref:SGNH/GDSL hydrolase family protein n=1 Tax=Mesobacillus harenae TaxID=2213203 RepID=UPI0015808DF5|nr:SGNH/GDSL hydrolase family protein [Mesobacillus harenae]